MKERGFNDRDRRSRLPRSRPRFLPAGWGMAPPCPDRAAPRPPAAGECVTHPFANWIDPVTCLVVPHGDILRAAALNRAVLLAESADLAEIHRWQLHVVCGLHLLRPDLAVGFEIFPRALQPVLDEWVEGGMATEDFIVATGWETLCDYPPDIHLPLFHFCRQHGVRMLALNCRAELVRDVGRDSWDLLLPDLEDGVGLPAPATDAYRNHLAAVTGWFGAAPPARTHRFIQAQQTWDRAFAENIHRALDRHSLVVGIVGRTHLEYGYGTPYQLRDLGVEDIAVLLPTEQPDFDPRREAGIADAVFRIARSEAPVPRRKAT